MYFLTMLEMVHFEILVHSNQSNDIKNLLKDISEQSVYLYLYLCNLHEANKYFKNQTRITLWYMQSRSWIAKEMELTPYEEMLTKAKHRSSWSNMKCTDSGKSTTLSYFWLWSRTLRHSGCEILKSNVSRQSLHYWSQKLLL